MSGFDFKFNTVIASLSFTVSIAAQLLIFRSAVASIGLASVGIFSLIQGLMIFSRAFETGIGQNLVRRMAMIKSSEGSDSIRWQLLFSSIILVVVPTLVLSFGAIFLIEKYISLRFGSSEIYNVKALALISAIISVVSVLNSLVGSAVEGVGHLVWRNVFLMIGSIVSLLFANALLGAYSVYGYAIIFLMTVVVQLFLNTTFILVKYRAGFRSGFVGTLKFSRGLLLENLLMNGIGLARLTFDPVTRVLLAEMGDLRLVAVFDILNRVVVSGRTLVQSAVSPLLYYGAHVSILHKDRHAKAFESAQSLINSVAIHFAAGAFASAFLVSYFLFNMAMPDAVLILLLLSGSASLNIVGIVGYYYALTIGRINRILVIHIWMILTNVMFGLVLGCSFGAFGVVTAYAIMMSVGGVLSFLLLPSSIRVSVLKVPSGLLFWIPVFCGTFGLALLALSHAMVISVTLLLSFSAALTAMVLVSLGASLSRSFSGALR